jgi:O-antigen ligase
MVAEAATAKKEGTSGAWLGTHNTYTQASSEGGIPAFIFFTAALIGSMRLSAGVYRRARKQPQFRDLANMALCLLLTLVGFSVNILFAHLAFTYYLPMLTGLSIAFAAAAEREIEVRSGTGLRTMESGARPT